MKRWYVVTPEYGTKINIGLDDGTGPMEYSADVIEIEAETRRDAVTLGVKEMLRVGRRGDFKWCLDARRDGVSPYAGVKAYPVEDEVGADTPTQEDR